MRCRVEERGAALDAVDLVALGQQKLRQVGAVLAGDAGDDRALGHGLFHYSSSCFILRLIVLATPPHNSPCWLTRPPDMQGLKRASS